MNEMINVNEPLKMKSYCGFIKKDKKCFLVNPFLKLVGEPILLSPSEYVEVTPETYLRIYNRLDLNRKEPECILYFDEELKPTLLTINDVKEINVESESDNGMLEKEKRHFVRIMSDSISDKINMSNIALFHFFKLNHYLESKGFFITDENREEKYLEIINTGDVDLLENLSKYLDALDEFNTIDEIYKKFQDFKLRIDSAVNDDELRIVYDDFSSTL